jgi:threonine synthase
MIMRRGRPAQSTDWVSEFVLYVSTRGATERLAFDDVVLAGLASDGGLYLPDHWPQLSAADLRGLGRLGYAELAAEVLALFADPVLDRSTLNRICADAYGGFAHPDVAPLVQIDGDSAWLLELFHGPTLAFKDYALQVLGRLFDLVLARRDERVTIVGATSGDTGSAAIEACRDRERVEIFILHPKGRVSDVQRRQMTTVTSPNVHNLAIEGTFDDCQDLVKALFNDRAFRDRHRLAAVNSINWARIAAQIVYYIYAAVRLGAPDRTVGFAVPTGNFGNVFAAWAAAKMGVPIHPLVVASNRNDILTRFFETGRMELGEVHSTLSPSMDIQVSSNFERYLFELFDRDGDRVAASMAEFRATGRFEVRPEEWQRACATFRAIRLDDAATKSVIGALFSASGMLVDPHTAIGIAGADRCRDTDDAPMVAVATAHPAKFPDAVEAATGMRPPLPERLADLLDRPERYHILKADLPSVQAHIDGTLAEKGKAP